MWYWIFCSATAYQTFLKNALAAEQKWKKTFENDI